MQTQQASQSDVYQTALRLLTRREYSSYELQQKLLQSGFALELIENTLTKLQALGMQSDQRFTEMLIRTRQRQGYGPVRIRYELQEQGINTVLQENYLRFNDPIWFELASQQRIKKFGLTLSADFKAKAKQMQFLHYRGFTSEQIAAVMKQ